MIEPKILNLWPAILCRVPRRAYFLARDVALFVRVFTCSNDERSGVPTTKPSHPACTFDKRDWTLPRIVVIRRSGRACSNCAWRRTEEVPTTPAPAGTRTGRSDPAAPRVPPRISASRASSRFRVPRRARSRRQLGFQILQAVHGEVDPPSSSALDLLGEQAPCRRSPPAARSCTASPWSDRVFLKHVHAAAAPGRTGEQVQELRVWTSASGEAPRADAQRQRRSL